MYKNKYLITLWTKNDDVVLITESVEELAEYLNRPIMNIRPIVSRAVKNKDKHTQFIVGKKILDLYLIEN